MLDSSVSWLVMPLEPKHRGLRRHACTAVNPAAPSESGHALLMRHLSLWAFGPTDLDGATLDVL